MSHRKVLTICGPHPEEMRNGSFPQMAHSQWPPKRNRRSRWKTMGTTLWLLSNRLGNRRHVSWIRWILPRIYQEFPENSPFFPHFLRKMVGSIFCWIANLSENSSFFSISSGKKVESIFCWIANFSEITRKKMVFLRKLRTVGSWGNVLHFFQKMVGCCFYRLIVDWLMFWERKQKRFSCVFDVWGFKKAKRPLFFRGLVRTTLTWS